jgi:hypothetical protein
LPLLTYPEIFSLIDAQIRLNKIEQAKAEQARRKAARNSRKR